MSFYKEDFLVCDVFVFGSENLALLHMTLWVHGGLECGLQLDGKMLGLWELLVILMMYTHQLVSYKVSSRFLVEEIRHVSLNKEEMKRDCVFSFLRFLGPY